MECIHNYSSTQRTSPGKISGSLSKWRHFDFRTENCNYTLFTTSLINIFVSAKASLLPLCTRSLTHGLILKFWSCRLLIMGCGGYKLFIISWTCLIWIALEIGDHYHQNNELPDVWLETRNKSLDPTPMDYTCWGKDVSCYG